MFLPAARSFYRAIDCPLDDINLATSINTWSPQGSVTNREALAGPSGSPGTGTSYFEPKEI